MPFPFFCLSYNPSENRILLKRLGILQYVFIVYTTMFAALVLQVTGKYCKESFSVYFPQIYLVIIRASSEFIANICMVIIRKKKLSFQMFELTSQILKYIFFIEYVVSTCSANFITRLSLVPKKHLC